MGQQGPEELVWFNNLQNAFAIHNNIRAVQVHRDYAQVELTVTENALNPNGTVHGGASFGLCDCAAGLAARSVGGRYVTQCADFHYYKPVTQGLLLAEGRVLHRGHTSVVVQTEARREDGSLAAGGIFTMFCVEQPQNP